MNSTLVFTFLGPDRPGLVERLSDEVAQHGGNWLESRMIELAGQFAGIARVALPAAQAESLEAALQALAQEGLVVNVQSGEGPGQAGRGGSSHKLHVLGPDRPGIVREISGALKQRQINVSEMSSNVSSAPMSGEALFEAHIAVDLPAGVALDELEEQLDDIAEKLAVDISCD